MAKKVFEGTVGNAKYLFDAKSGQEVVRIAKNESKMEAASKHRLELVPRKQADKTAVRKLINAWIAAKKPSMKTVRTKAKPGPKLKLRVLRKTATKTA